jgi:hypothetical protein
LHFGEFSIGIDSRDGRRLGVMPTLYYYRADAPATGCAVSPEMVSEQMIVRLFELRALLIALAHVESETGLQRLRPRGREYLKRNQLTLDNESVVMRALGRLTKAKARGVMQLFATDRVDAWNLAEWVEILLSLFQTADSSSRDEHLAYFRQREWRVVQLYSDGLVCVPLNPSKWRIGSGVRKSSRPFLSSALKHLEALADRAALPFAMRDCYLLARAAQKPFLHFISEIVVPPSSELRAKRLLDRFDVQLVGRELCAWGAVRFKTRWSEGVA